ncbi:MAG: CotH kinase family protein [Bacteroidetes bacterium]|nr:CotH kinase family protein [Bacteroidota bacterium]
MNTFLKKAVAPALLFLLLNLTGFSQIVINEICPSNVNTIQNSNGDYDDWIELYNAGGSSVNLQGYGLTDDITKPFRFTFPSFSLGSGKRVLVFASDSTSNVIVDHYEMAVNGLSSFKYKSGSASLDTNWRNNSFNDGSWSSGNGGIGFGDGDDNTTISATVSVMMRKTFTIPDTSQILKAILMMDYDDGFVAYLNGVEIARSNLSGSPRPSWNTLALSSNEARNYRGLAIDSFFIDPVFLKTIIRQGSNVFTVETHDVSASSTDMSSEPYLFFGMKSTGLTFSNPPSWFNSPDNEFFNAKFKLTRTGETVTLFNPGGSIANQVTFPAVDIDHSYGRKPDGGVNFCLMATPTPETSNNSTTCYNGYAGTVIFNRPSGFYSSTQNITLTSTIPGASIRYTTNGNVPKTTDRLYTSAIQVSSTKTIRARVFLSGYLPGPTITNTYLINEDTHLPVFSIVTDSLNLWDYNTGIYVKGPNAESASPYFGANFWQDWAKPAAVEFFDKNQNSIVKFDSDIEISGNYSRAKDQKSFEIKLSDRYGTSEINYSFWPDKPYVDKVDKLIIHNAGTDWNVVHFRDGLMERVMKNTYSGYLSSEPAIMFLNGAYWGVYNIREHNDNNWIKTNYGLDKDEIDLLREGGSTMEVKEGSDVSFWDMYNYATSQNASSQAYYDHINSVLDLKNYADYFIAETYYNNGDWIGEWTNNIKLWRPNAPGSKWKYLLYDTDYGCGLKGSVNDNRLSMAINPVAFSHSSEMFDAILDNPTFKRYFINRYADLINTAYLPSNFNDEIDHFQDLTSFDMVNHFAKWGSNTSTWQSNINSMKSFINARPDKARDYIKSQFSLAAKVTLTLQCSPAGSGRIEISTITPTSLPWSGVYFNGNPVTITAIPNPGYTFDHFRSNVTISSNNFNQSVTYNFTANDVITAYFTGSAASPQVTISEFNYNADSAANSGDWIELWNYGSTALNISGWKLKDGQENHVFVFPTGTVIPANSYLVVVEDSLKFDSQFPNVNNWIGQLGFNFSNGGDEVRLFKYDDILHLSFTYQDNVPWPYEADGGGYTCELVNRTVSLNDGSNWFPGCLGGSPGRAYSASISSTVSISGNTTICTGDNATLNVTNVPGYTYQWRRNNVSIPGANADSLIATLAGNYTVSVSDGSCSVMTPAFTLTVVTTTANPVTTSASSCGASSLTLTATASDSIFWYDAPNGTELGSGETFITPVLNSTTTYYARSSRNCPSGFVSAVATITQQAATPLVNDVFRCGPGAVTLTASDTATIHWYNAPTGGALLETGSSFVTNIIPHDTVFYVEAGNYCPSQRIEVHVTINTTDEPIANDVSRCGTGTLTLTATSSSPLLWYSSEFGGSSVGSGASWTTPSMSATDTFYVEANGGCASTRVRVIAIVSPIPPAPTASNVTICGTGTVDLNAISTEQVYWFSSGIGGTLLYTGTTFTTPVLTTTTTYYIEAGYTCRSSRTAVQAIVSSVPAPPAASDVSRCGTGTVNLLANSPELISWFDAAVAGNLLATGDAFTTPSISVTTPYYAEAGTACLSSRTMVNAIVEPVPAPPTASDVSRCGSGTVTLNATSSQTIYWYANASGGSPLATGASYTTPSLSSNTTYYVETGNSCRSTRIPVQALITSQPSAPSVVDGARCGSGTVVLTASSPAVINWYANASGGPSLGTGSTFTTPVISTTTTYYAEAGSGCNSPRVPVQATITSAPVAPVAANVSRCGPGTVTLNAVGTQTINWYSAPTGGTLLASSASYTTPSISSTTTYYVEQGAGSCQSSRVAVQAIVNSIPSAPSASDVSRCGTGSVTLTATSSTTVNWYSSSSGGTQLGTGLTFNTPSISSTTTYYAEANNGCASSRTAVDAIINSVPAVPSAPAVSRCGAGTVNLVATSSEQCFWYSAASGGTLLFTGLSFTTPNITSTTTYYVETGNSCRSNRIAVQAIITTQPASPSVTDGSRCGTGTVNLSATSATQINWYTSASGGSSVATGTTFTTPSISSTTIYYADAGTGCNSPRVPVTATIDPIPSVPSASDVTRCGTGSVTLTATATEQVYWYSASSGGTLLHTGNTFNTPSITTSTTYYVEQGNSCRSNRVAVDAIITNPPASPVVTDGNRCGPGTVVLSATSLAQINWYANASGGTALGTGTSFTTPSISVTTIFYADAGTGCNSARVPVTANINSAPAAPVANDVARCSTGTVTLTATGTGSIKWYSASSGGSVLFTGSSFTTPSISVTTTYYVEADNGCVSSRTSVDAIINSPPAEPILTDGSRCGTGTVVLTASSPVNVNWYSSASGGTVLGTGLSFTTPPIGTTTTFYADAGSGCNSARVPVQAIVNSVPTLPVAADVSRCNSGTVTLTASSNGPLTWYSTSTGGTALGTGSTFTTPSLTSTTTYYVEAGDVCLTNRVAVDAIITSAPPVPVLTDGDRCGTGSVVLTATSSDQVNWYSSASGGSSLGTGLSFNTPSISVTTTFYADAGIGCNSARVSVQAVVNPIPAVPVAVSGNRCGTGTVTLTATSPEQIYWYSTASGGVLLGTGNSFTTPSISVSTNYYVETGNDCRSNRISVQAVINPIPAAPATSDVSRCNTGTITLNAVSSESIFWYDTPSGGNLLFTGPAFTTPSLSVSTPYYVATGDVCISPRVQVYAIITSPPADPIVSDAFACGTDSALLIGTASTQINWYDAPSGGNLIGIGDSIYSPVISVNTTFYAIAGLGCNSNPVAVDVDINPVPSDPTTQSSFVCGSGTVTLNATSTEQLYWYDSPTGGTLLLTGSTFVSPSISATTTYYVEAGDLCRSNRIPVDALVTPYSVINTLNSASNCGDGSLTLEAISTDLISWYDAPGGTLLATGSTFVTPVLTASQTYYVIAGSDCPSAIQQVNATIYDLPVVDLGPDSLFYQSGQTVTLDAGAGFLNYLWNTSETTQQISVTNSSFYEVTAIDSNGCAGNDIIYVDFSIGIEQSELSNSLSVYPNPTHDKFVLELNKNSIKKLSVKISSSDGKLVNREILSSPSGAYKHEFSMQGYSAGIYFVELQSENQKAIIKLIVQ